MCNFSLPCNVIYMVNCKHSRCVCVCVDRQVTGYLCLQLSLSKHIPPFHAHTYTLLCQRQQLYTNCTCLTRLTQSRVSPVRDLTTKSYIHVHILSALNQHNFINMQPLLTHKITHKVKHEFKPLQPSSWPTFPHRY